MSSHPKLDHAQCRGGIQGKEALERLLVTITNSNQRSWTVPTYQLNEDQGVINTPCNAAYVMR